MKNVNKVKAISGALKRAEERPSNNLPKSYAREKTESNWNNWPDWNDCPDFPNWQNIGGNPPE